MTIMMMVMKMMIMMTTDDNNHTHVSRRHQRFPHLDVAMDNFASPVIGGMEEAQC